MQSGIHIPTGMYVTTVGLLAVHMLRQFDTANSDIMRIHVIEA